MYFGSVTSTCKLLWLQLLLLLLLLCYHYPCNLTLASTTEVVHEIEPLPEEQPTHCAIVQNATHEVGTVRVTRLWTALHITCTVAVLRRLRGTFGDPIMVCANPTESVIKMNIDYSTGTPHILCQSPSLIRIGVEYLDSQGPPSYDDSLVHEEWSLVPPSAKLQHSVSMHLDGYVSARHTVTGILADSGCCLIPRGRGQTVWTISPIIVMTLFNAGGRDLGIYSPNLDFLVDTSVVLIPCLSVFLPNPSLYQEWEQEADGCTISRLRSSYDHAQGHYLRPPNSITFTNSSFLCCSERPYCSPSPPAYCVPFRLLEPQAALTVFPAMPADESLRFFTSEDGGQIPFKLECSAWTSVEIHGRLGAMEPTAVMNLIMTCHGTTTMLDKPVLVDCLEVSTGRSLHMWNITTHDVRGNRNKSDALASHLTFREKPATASALQPNEPAWFFNLSARQERERAPVFQCSSDVHDDAELLLLKCENPTHCRMLEWCLKSDKCGGLITKGTDCQPGGNILTLPLHSHRRRSCQEAQLPSPGALLHCSAGGQTYTQLRWLGLSGLQSYVYQSYENATCCGEILFEMAQLHGPLDSFEEVPEEEGGGRIFVCYTELPCEFTCYAHPFWQAKRPYFFYEFHSNSSRRLAVPLGGDNARVESPGYGGTVELVMFTTDIKSVACVLKNRDDAAGHTDVTVPVKVIQSRPPKILNEDSWLQLEDDGLPQRLECTVNGVPQPEIKWTRRRRDGKLEDVDIQMIAWNEPSVLIFDKFEIEQEGTYTCTASNGLDQASLDFVVSLLLTPPAASSFESGWIGAGIASAVILTALAPAVILIRRCYLDVRFDI